MAKILLLVVCVYCWLWSTEGQSQSCTDGFPTLEEVIASSGSLGSNGVLRIIPALKFNCSGFVTKWTVAALFRSQNSNRFVQLQVWRSTGGSTFVSTGSTPITAETENLTGIYEQLPETPLQVEVGDVLGIFQPFSPTLRVEYETGGPTNLILDVTDDSPPDSVVLPTSTIDALPLLPLVTAEISVSATTTRVLFTLPHTPIPTNVPPPTDIPIPTTPILTNVPPPTDIPIPTTLPHTPTTITLPSPQPSQPGDPSTTNDSIPAVAGGVVGALVLSALTASGIIILLVCKKRRTGKEEMATPKLEELDVSTTETTRQEESLGHDIITKENEAYALMAHNRISTHQNVAYGVTESAADEDRKGDYIVGSPRDEVEVVYENAPSQPDPTEVSVMYDYVAVTW